MTCPEKISAADEAYLNGLSAHREEESTADSTQRKPPLISPTPLSPSPCLISITALSQIQYPVLSPSPGPSRVRYKEHFDPRALEGFRCLETLQSLYNVLHSWFVLLLQATYPGNFFNVEHVAMHKCLVLLCGGHFYLWLIWQIRIHFKMESVPTIEVYWLKKISHFPVSPQNALKWANILPLVN